jgi:hypothetical protein
MQHTPADRLSRVGLCTRAQADVLNRGFGGFNTKAAALAVPEMLDSLSKQQVALAIVWLGANDAAVPEGAE